MILTEEEAKTKRCQESFGQFYVTPDGRSMMAMAGNFGAGYALQASPSYCIGSACMAWRWHEYNLDPVDRHRVSGKAGYCGKAGRP